MDADTWPISPKSILVFRNKSDPEILPDNLPAATNPVKDTDVPDAVSHSILFCNLTEPVIVCKSFISLPKLVEPDSLITTLLNTELDIVKFSMFRSSSNATVLATAPEYVKSCIFLPSVNGAFTPTPVKPLPSPTNEPLIVEPLMIEPLMILPYMVVVAIS